MSIDEILLYVIYLVFLVCLVLTYRFNKKIAIINFLTLVAYTVSFFTYLSSANLEGKGGTSFVWFFFLLVLTGVHFFGVVVYLVTKWLKVPQKSFFNKKYLLSIILSTVLIGIGMLFRIYHWPWGNVILLTGIALICITGLFFIFEKYKKA